MPYGSEHDYLLRVCITPGACARARRCGAGAYVPFRRAMTVDVGDQLNSQSVTIADLNSDSLPDIFVANSFQANELLINDGAGGFVAVTEGDAVAR